MGTICYHVLSIATDATATRDHVEIATSAASQIATVATATTTGIAEIIATSAAAPTPARLVRSRGAAATAVDRPTDRAAAGDPHIGPVAAVHPTGPAAVEGHPTG